MPLQKIKVQTSITIEAGWDSRLLMGPCCAEPLQIVNELLKGESAWKN